VNAVNEISQLATAMVTVAFAALMLVAGQQFIEYKSRQAFTPAALRIAKTNGETVGVRMVLAHPDVPATEKVLAISELNSGTSCTAENFLCTITRRGDFR
jgi:hypothetical protein